MKWSDKLTECIDLDLQPTTNACTQNSKSSNKIMAIECNFITTEATTSNFPPFGIFYAIIVS